MSAHAEKIALTNATLINPAKSQISQNATIIIDGEKVAAAGDAKTVSVPKDARVAFQAPYLQEHIALSRL